MSRPEGMDACGPEWEPPPMDPESCGAEADDPGLEGAPGRSMSTWESVTASFTKIRSSRWTTWMDRRERKATLRAMKTTSPATARSRSLSPKDFGPIIFYEVDDFRKLISRTGPQAGHADQPGERPRGPRKKFVDMRRTIRQELFPTASDIVRLFHRNLKIKKNDIVLLSDVSGSMHFYNQFLVQFIYGLQSHGSRKAFSTALNWTRLSIVDPLPS